MQHAMVWRCQPCVSWIPRERHRMMGATIQAQMNCHAIEGHLFIRRRQCQSGLPRSSMEGRKDGCRPPFPTCALLHGDLHGRAPRHFGARDAELGVEFARDQIDDYHNQELLAVSEEIQHRTRTRRGRLLRGGGGGRGGVVDIMTGTPMPNEPRMNMRFE